MKIIEPMAAHDGTIYKDGKMTSEFVGHPDYVMQVKLDGSRYIAQWDEEGKFRFTSRHISVKTGLPVVKTEHAKKLFGFRDEKHLAGTIIDGEVVCFCDADWNEELGDYACLSHSSEVNRIMLTKEEKIDERLAELTKEYMRVEYHTYDILYVSGGGTEDLVNMDYETRHYVLNIQEKLIKAMIPETKEKFHVLTQLENTQENIDFVIASGQEGVMLKLKKGKYKQGTRSKDWVKVKKLITEDAIILGGVEGNGKYKGTLGALIIGQYIEGKLTEVGTISGMDDATRKYFWDWLLEMKLETWADWRDTTKGEIWLGEQDYKAHPETLKIVEFIAQEKTKARYRHPRFVQERLDKNYFECTF